MPGQTRKRQAFLLVCHCCPPTPILDLILAGLEFRWCSSSTRTHGSLLRYQSLPLSFFQKKKKTPWLDRCRDLDPPWLDLASSLGLVGTNTPRPPSRTLGQMFGGGRYELLGSASHARDTESKAIRSFRLDRRYAPPCATLSGIR